MSEENLSASIARRSNFPSARMCFCPATSSNVRGLILAARGASAVAFAGPDASGIDSGKSDSMDCVERVNHGICETRRKIFYSVTFILKSLRKKLTTSSVAR